MMRVAVFTECYHDLNGVGHTYRKLVEYAERKGLKLDMYIPGRGKVDERGSVRIIEVMVDIPIEYYPEIFFDAWSVPRHIFDHLPRKVESNFRNEIVWRRTSAKGLAFTRFPSNHDNILRYSKQ